MATSTRRVALAAAGTALAAGFSLATMAPAQATAPANAVQSVPADSPARIQGTTKADCPFSTKTFVYGGRLYAKTTVNCKKRHSIVITANIHRKATIGNKLLASGRKELKNFKGKTNVMASVPCNTVSPKRIYRAYAKLYDIRALGYPIEVDDAASGYKKGC